MLGFFRKLNQKRLSNRVLKKLITRQKKLKEFGLYAEAIYVKTQQGNFLVDPSDNFVSKSLLKNGKYGLEEISWATKFLKKNSHCLVLGGHIGTLVIPLSKLCKELTVFEANPNTFDLLSKNIQLNEIRNVNAFNKAVNYKVEPLKFLLNSDNSGGSKRLPINLAKGYFYDNPEEVLVDSIALDSFLKFKSFDLIFVDIEGSEFFAFKGMQKILRNSKVLITEFVPHHLRNVASISPLEFWNTLQPHFNHMFIPKSKLSFKGEKDILKQLNSIFNNNENHNNIVFSKLKL